MPDPTDFVTDLPADFEIFGDAVDTTVDAIDNRVTDLEVITAEGDLIVGDASGDPVALPIGAAGTVLTSDGDTAEWAAAAAGGMTQIATGSLSGAAVTISSISSSYKDLVLVVQNYSAATSFNGFGFRINNVTSGYGSTATKTSGSSNSNQTAQSTIKAGSSAYASPVAASNDVIKLTIPNYSLTSTEKYVLTTFQQVGEAGTVISHSTVTAVIDQIDIVVLSGGNFDGGTFTLFGVN
jgi:hypothetical protein